MSASDTERQATATDAEPPPAPPRRALHVAAMVVSVGLAVVFLGVLVYGVLGRSAKTTIDDALAQDHGTPAPAYRLAVLRRGSLGSSLTARLAPALASGWVTPKKLAGIPYVLNIWASWCIPCQQEAPVLERAWQQVRPQGVLFVGLDQQDVTEDGRAFLAQFHIDYLNIRDPTNDTPLAYGATGVPETYFISGRGDVVGHVIGVVDPGQLRAGIAAAVAGRPHASAAGGAHNAPR